MAYFAAVRTQEFYEEFLVLEVLFFLKLYGLLEVDRGLTEGLVLCYQVAAQDLEFDPWELHRHLELELHSPVEDALTVFRPIVGVCLFRYWLFVPVAGL